MEGIWIRWFLVFYGPSWCYTTYSTILDTIYSNVLNLMFQTRLSFFFAACGLDKPGRPCSLFNQGHVVPQLSRVNASPFSVSPWALGITKFLDAMQPMLQSCSTLFRATIFLESHFPHGSPIITDWRWHAITGRPTRREGEKCHKKINAPRHTTSLMRWLVGDLPAVYQSEKLTVMTILFRCDVDS